MNPQFDFDTNENSIVLHTGSTSICIEDTTYVGEGEAKLELLPKASIVFDAEFKDVDPKHIFSETLSQSEIESFSFNQHKIEGFNIGSHSDIPTWRTKWLAKSEPVALNLQPNEETKRIIFHLFNFVDFIGSDSSIKTQGDSRKRISHINLSWNLYQIKIESLFSTKESIEILKHEGGYRLTQVGNIEKSDGSSFSDEEQKDLLEGLRYFISFAKGSWCSPVCPVGLNASDEKVWYSLNSPDKQWQSHSSWFDSQHASDLEELFPLFMDTWKKENWKSTIKEILYWYLNANDPSRGVDAGLILSQAALERLSFEYVVNEKKLLSSKGFKDIWASDKFRVLFSSLDIPLEIPLALTNLTQSSNSNNWSDAPYALTQIRNSLIHPEHKKHGQISTDLFIESWNLSLWYLEMAILAICGYSGTYANRLTDQRWVGSVENVPWRKEVLDNENEESS